MEERHQPYPPSIPPSRTEDGAPSGRNFERDTPWTDDPDLTGLVIDRLAAVTDGGICLDVGGGSGRLAVAGCERRPDLRWLVLDLTRPSSPSARASYVVGDGGRIPLGDESLACAIYVSSIHYIGVEHGLSEAARCLAPGGVLLVLAKVADQFASCARWHRRLHELRSLVPRHSYRSDDITAPLVDRFSIVRQQTFYRWCDYPLDAWLTRGGDLPEGRTLALESLLLGADTALATDGIAPVVVDGPTLRNRIQWLFVEARRLTA